MDDNLEDTLKFLALGTGLLVVAFGGGYMVHAAGKIGIEAKAGWGGAPELLVGGFLCLGSLLGSGITYYIGVSSGVKYLKNRLGRS